MFLSSTTSNLFAILHSERRMRIALNYRKSRLIKSADIRSSVILCITITAFNGVSYSRYTSVTSECHSKHSTIRVAVAATGDTIRQLLRIDRSRPSTNANRVERAAPLHGRVACRATRAIVSAECATVERPR